MKEYLLIISETLVTIAGGIGSKCNTMSIFSPLHRSVGLLALGNLNQQPQCFIYFCIIGESLGNIGI
jgi:hypothetical protein